MGNKVRFTMTNVPAGLTQMNSVVTDLNYDVLWSGVHTITGVDVELDIGTAGADQQGVWIYNNNAQTGEELSAKVMGGYSIVELV